MIKKSFLALFLLAAMMTEVQPVLACTSVIVSGKATKDGRPLIFKNRDTSTLHNMTIVVQGQVYRYIGLVNAEDTAPVNVWGGHNEAGFGIINTAAYNLNGDGGDSGPYDITKIIENDPEAYLSGERWEAAGGGPFLADHYWGEPLFGYYFQTDRWVLSRHCQMLTDAGVDFLVFDTTNGFSETDYNRVLALIDVWYGYYTDGWNVPKLAFYTNTDSGWRLTEFASGTIS